jgi:hypothetical protein
LRRQRPLQVPGVREGRGLAYSWSDVAAAWQPQSSRLIGVHGPRLT